MSLSCCPLPVWPFQRGDYVVHFRSQMEYAQLTLYQFYSTCHRFAFPSFSLHLHLQGAELVQICIQTMQQLVLAPIMIMTSSCFSFSNHIWLNQGVKLTTHPHLVLRSWRSRAILLLPLWAHVACYRAKTYLTFMTKRLESVFISSNSPQFQVLKEALVQSA